MKILVQQTPKHLCARGSWAFCVGKRVVRVFGLSLYLFTAVATVQVSTPSAAAMPTTVSGSLQNGRGGNWWGGWWPSWILKLLQAER